MVERSTGFMDLDIVKNVLSLLRKGCIVLFVSWFIMKILMSALLCVIIARFGFMELVKNSQRIRSWHMKGSLLLVLDAGMT
jgi:hypothetical protein